MKKTLLVMSLYLFAPLVQLHSSVIAIKRVDQTEEHKATQASLHRNKKLGFCAALVGSAALLAWFVKYLFFSPSLDNGLSTDSHLHPPKDKRGGGDILMRPPVMDDKTMSFVERAKQLIVTQRRCDGAGTMENRASMAVLSGNIFYAQSYEEQQRLYKKMRATLPLQDQKQLFDDLLYEQLWGQPRQACEELAALSPLDLYTIVIALLEKSYQASEELSNTKLLEMAEDVVTKEGLQLSLDTTACRGPLVNIMQELKMKVGFRSPAEYARRKLLIDVLAKLIHVHEEGDGIVRIPYECRKKIIELSLSEDERHAMVIMLSSLLSTTFLLNDNAGDFPRRKQKSQYLALLLTADPKNEDYVIERMAFCLERLYYESSLEDMEKPFTRKDFTASLDEDTPAICGWYGLDQLEKAFNKACSYLCIPPEGIQDRGKGESLRKQQAWFIGFKKLLTKGAL